MTTLRTLALLALALIPSGVHAAVTTPASMPTIRPGFMPVATITPARANPDSYLFNIDPPPGYVFVKTPMGWKVKDRLPVERMASLPAGI